MNSPYPERQLAAAARAGKLVAMRVIEPEDILPDLVEAALAAGYRGHVGGLRTTLSWRVQDSRREWELKRGQAFDDIYWQLRPLLDARAPSKTLLDTAYAINRAAGAPLLGREVLAAVESQVAEFLSWTRRRTRQRATGGRRHAA